MTKIMFICHGNICRSPMAEFVFKNMVNNLGLNDMFSVSSAATSTEEIGNDIYSPVKKKLKEVGVPFDRRTASKVKKDDYKKYDYLICMDSNNVRNLSRIVGNDYKGKINCLLDFTDNPRDIVDPWYTGNFDKTYSDIVEGCQALLRSILDNS